MYDTTLGKYESKMDVIINGIDQSYTRWLWHSENTRGDDQLGEDFSILLVH